MDFSDQLGTFFITVATGLILGGMFDFYRVLRGILKPPWFLTSLADLLFWLLATAIVFAALLIGNWGELRLYAFFGLLIGLLGYYRLLSHTMIHLFAAVIRQAIRAFRLVALALGYCLYKPARFLLKMVAAPLHNIGKNNTDGPGPPDQKTPPQ